MLPVIVCYIGTFREPITEGVEVVSRVDFMSVCFLQFDVLCVVLQVVTVDLYHGKTVMRPVRKDPTATEVLLVRFFICFLLLLLVWCFLLFVVGFVGVCRCGVVFCCCAIFLLSLLCCIICGCNLGFPFLVFDAHCVDLRSCRAVFSF